MARQSATTPIYEGQIHHKAAWRGSDFSSKDDVAFDLTAAQVTALEEILLRVRGLNLHAIGPEHARHPALDAPLSGVFDEVQFGRGLVILRGIPVGGHSDDDVEKMCAALSMHFGLPLSQDPLGSTVKRVTDEFARLGRDAARAFAIGNKPSGPEPATPAVSDVKRNANPELIMHSDVCEVLGLYCVRPAREGGESQFASALAIHNQIQATRPDLLPILYTGFPYRRSKMDPRRPESLTGYNIPIFSNVDGNISLTFITGNILQGLDAYGRIPTDEELEALIVVQEVADSVRFEFRLAGGEGVVANNLITLHSRSAYYDWDEPERRRLMLRYWLEAKRDRRPMIPQMHIFENVGDRSGCDPAPELAASEAYSVPSYMLDLMKAAEKRKAQAARSET